MKPRLTLLAAALALGAAPLPALAQSWPASVVAAAPRMLPAPGRPFVVVREADTSVQRKARRLPPTDPAARRPPLKLSRADEVPDVTIKPKAEWSDDEGWSASATKVAFKRHF